MTVKKLRELLSAMPAEMDDYPVVAPIGRLLDGEVIAGDVVESRHTLLIPGGGNHRRIYRSVPLGEKETAVDALIIVTL